MDHQNLLRRPPEVGRLGDQCVLARGRLAIVLDLCRTGLSEIDISEAGEMRAVDLGEITHRPPRFAVGWTSRGSARSCARGSQWLWRGLRGRAARPALPAARAAREAPASVARQLSSVVAGLGRGLGTRLRRASRMVRAWRQSTSLARLCSRPFSVTAAGFPTGIAPKTVHPARITNRRPSGSTTSSKATPRRCVGPPLQNPAPEGL